MSDFIKFKTAVNKRLAAMMKENLFYVEIDRDELFSVYLAAFPEGTNPLYRVRTEHDCNCCKQFIRNAGSIVTFNNGKLSTIWDVSESDVGPTYKIVADALAAHVRTKNVKNVFRHYQRDLGADKSHQHVDKDGNPITTTGFVKQTKIVTWDHFYFQLESKYYQSNQSVDQIKGEFRTNYQVLEASMKLFTIEGITTVLDLINSNSLYRGTEFKGVVELIKKSKNSYDSCTTDVAKQEFLWKTSIDLGIHGRFKNSVIGTLISDISEGYDVEDSVASYESKVAPENYKRSSSLVTPAMIKKAEEQAIDLHIQDSLERRYAVASDITINNVLFADRDVRPVMKGMGIFSQLQEDVVEKAPNTDKVEEVPVNDFIENILPQSTSLEIWVDNKQANNLVSLISPKNPDAERIFKWGNNFSWSYNGEVTDSIKEKVKKAGGNVTGVLRCSLSWSNYDDLDLHVHEPKGGHIYFGNKRGISGGLLDVDMNAGSGKSRTPVENIIWSHGTNLLEGVYKVHVNNFSKRETKNEGYEVEIEFDDKKYNFVADKSPKSGQTDVIAEITYSKKNGLSLNGKMVEQNASKTLWGINTQKFHKVSMVMKSPNHWDGEHTGNQHLFFMLDKCRNPETSRGFYNEFLRDELVPHRKVFEVLGSKLKVEESNDQLSGLGFSSTQRNDVVCRVKGKINRTFKIKF